MGDSAVTGEAGDGEGRHDGDHGQHDISNSHPAASRGGCPTAEPGEAGIGRCRAR
jgi:hypothetical protein